MLRKGREEKMGVMRGKPDQARAAALCDRLQGFDYWLMDLVLQCQADMTVRGAGELVNIHRALRRLRYRIETEAGLDPPSGPSRQPLHAGNSHPASGGALNR